MTFFTLNITTMKRLFIITATSLVMFFTTPTKAQQNADSMMIQTILQE